MPQNSFDSIIISDTSCLIALTQINQLDLLKKLYKTVAITPEDDYKNDPELTIFTQLDGEDFYEPR